MHTPKALHSVREDFQPRGIALLQHCASSHVETGMAIPQGFAPWTRSLTNYRSDY